MDLYQQISTAAQFEPAKPESVPPVDRTEQTVIGLDWAARQKPATPPEVYRQPTTMPIPN